MLQYFILCYQICLLRKGPQDLPHSVSRLVTAAAILFGLLMSMHLFLDTDREDAFTFEIILLICPFVYVGVVLWITQKLNRFVQSMLAMIGVECWVNLVMIVYVTLIAPNAPLMIVQFIPIIIYIWRLTVISFIFKQMISSDNLAAILLTVTFEMLRIMTVLSLMGQVNT